MCRLLHRNEVCVAAHRLLVQRVDGCQILLEVIEILHEVLELGLGLRDIFDVDLEGNPEFLRNLSPLRVRRDPA